MHFTHFTAFIVLALFSLAPATARRHFSAFVTRCSCRLSFIIVSLNRVLIPIIICISVALVVSISLILVPPVIFLVSLVVSRVYTRIRSPDLVPASKHIIVKPPEVCREDCSDGCRAEDQRECLHGLTRTAHYNPLRGEARAETEMEFYGDTKISSSWCKIL